MCPVSLYDTLTFGFHRREFSVDCDAPQVPRDESNLAYRAAVTFWDRVDETIRRTMGAIGITIEKRIPVGAGLGGGSSNAAAVLLTLNRCFGDPIPPSGLFAAGRSLGADVPFFIFGKPAIATGIGERLHAYEGMKPFPLVLIYPGFGVSTAEIFREFDLALTKPERKIRKDPFAVGPFDPRYHLYNDLEPVTARRHGDVLSVKAALAVQGALGAVMTGSGPTVFGVFDNRAEAENAEKALEGRAKWRIFIAEILV